MKTGTTIDRLDRAAKALNAAAVALGQLWGSDSRIQFTNHLEVALELIEEVLTKSEMLTDSDRERLGFKLGLRLLGLPDECVEPDEEEARIANEPPKQEWSFCTRCGFDHAHDVDCYPLKGY